MAKATKNRKSEKHDQATIDRTLTSPKVRRAISKATEALHLRLEKEQQSVPVGLDWLNTKDLWDIARQRNENTGEMMDEACIAFRELAERGALPSVDLVGLSEFIGYRDHNGEMTYEARLAFRQLVECGVLDMLDEEELRDITRQRNHDDKMTAEAQAAFAELARRSVEPV